VQLPFFAASSTATAQATVAPTIGLLPMQYFDLNASLIVTSHYSFSLDITGFSGLCPNGRSTMFPLFLPLFILQYL